ncbi:MAG: alpha/beta hydrolase [Candidatus Binatia bacterium]
MAGVGLVAIAFLAGCSPIGFVNRALPSAGIDVRRDIAYGEHPRQRLDVYRRANGVGPAPVVVFFYGGSWQAGDRGHYPFVADALASEGFVTVVPDYRTHPDVKFPVFMEDAARVVRWCRDHVAELGGDPTRIYLMGHSAGGHIAVLLAVDERYLEQAGLDRSAIRAVVGIAGPYDFLPFRSDTLRTLFGPEEGWPTTQPINFIDGREPPMLLLHGSWDTTVGPGNARRLTDRICQHGGSARAIFYPYVGHMTIIGAFSRPLRWIAPVLRDTVTFLKEN